MTLSEKFVNFCLWCLQHWTLSLSCGYFFPQILRSKTASFIGMPDRTQTETVVMYKPSMPWFGSGCFKMFQVICLMSGVGLGVWFWISMLFSYLLVNFAGNACFFCNSTFGLVFGDEFWKVRATGDLDVLFSVACIPFSFIESDRILETTTILDGFRVVITPIASFSDVESTPSMPWLPSRFPAARATTSWMWHCFLTRLHRFFSPIRRHTRLHACLHGRVAGHP